ncbi:MAG: radical SAM protein [Firmicutes bacterium]|nr:radical SAM protein [Bacillota bacterium]MBU4533435.1 radical SAM protein [Bacillota bacterium]MBU4554331.1 radical SAM protein [Bacillota bacterium]
MKIRTGPSGVHIFDRATGLNVLLEEACVPPALWATAPRQVSVALTNTCDLACTHCFAPKNPAELSFERVATWLDELDANGCLGVGFGGGEPTLYRHLVKLCHYAATQTGLAVTFTTHAHHLDDSLAEALAGAVHFVRISMDGVGATYEAIRGRSFSALRRRFETARRLSPLGINFVVNAQTLPDLDAAATLAAEVGASEILLLPEQPHQGKGGIDAGTFDFLCRWVNLHNGTVPLTVSETGADGLPTCDPLPGETGLCAYAHIDASGRLKTSSYAGNGVVIGDAGVMRALNVLRTTQKEGLE